MGVCRASMFRQRSSSLCSEVRGSGRYSSWARDGSPPPSPPSLRGKPGGLRSPLTIRSSAAGSLLSHSDTVSTEPVEQAVESFVGLDCRDLGGGRLASHRVPHPPLEPRLTGALTTAGSWEGGWHENRPILSRWLPQKDTADACSKVRSSVDWERIHIEWSLLQPGRVVGDECERAEMDLAALNQNSA